MRDYLDFYFMNFKLSRGYCYALIFIKVVVGSLE